MEGKTKTFSRVAGIINIVAAVFLILTLFFFIVVAGFGIVGGDLSESNQSSSSSESSGSSGNSAGEEVASAIVVGCTTAFVMALGLVVVLAVLLPLSLVNVITELVIGPRCFRKAPKRGTVIYSTILKSLTIPLFKSSAYPEMDWSGVFSSWETFAVNSCRILSASRCALPRSSEAIFLERRS